MKQKIALFLDRDDTLNINTHYTHLIEDMYLCEGVIPFFAQLSSMPFLQPIVVTNQSGVGRGYYKQWECLRFENALRFELLSQAHYSLPAEFWYHAWSEDDNDPMRKPNPGMLKLACKQHNLIPGYMIGDKPCDMLAGHNAGCRLSLQVDKQITLLDRLQIIKQDLKDWDLAREYIESA
jgi:D-glycero-D-manno-heptose 1,7-bisphosphate phosphatase